MRICRKVARRTSLSFGVTILAMLLLISAGSAQQVTVYHWLRGSDANYNFIAAQIPEFERRNPDIKIELIHVIPPRRTAVHAGVATNMDIDVLWTTRRKLAALHDGGWLLPMDDRRVGLDLGDFILPSWAWPAGRNLYGSCAALPAPTDLQSEHVRSSRPVSDLTYENSFVTRAG